MVRSAAAGPLEGALGSPHGAWSDQGGERFDRPVNWAQMAAELSPSGPISFKEELSRDLQPWRTRRVAGGRFISCTEIHTETLTVSSCPRSVWLETLSWSWLLDEWTLPKCDSFQQPPDP